MGVRVQAIVVCRARHMFLKVSQTYHVKKSTHQHFLSAKNPHENNTNQASKLKVYWKNVDFHRPPPPESEWFLHS